jgi:hypothetical protein
LSRAWHTLCEVLRRHRDARARLRRTCAPAGLAEVPRVHVDAVHRHAVARGQMDRRAADAAPGIDQDVTWPQVHRPCADIRHADLPPCMPRGSSPHGEPQAAHGPLSAPRRGDDGQQRGGRRRGKAGDECTRQPCPLHRRTRFRRSGLVEVAVVNRPCLVGPPEDAVVVAAVVVIRPHVPSRGRIGSGLGGGHHGPNVRSARCRTRRRR